MRTVRKGDLYRDLAPDMADRDRRLRVITIGDDGRAECQVEHDLWNTTGRTTPIHVHNLGNPRKFELLAEADALTADPRFTALLAAMAKVHGPKATPRDYARAAFDALGLTPKGAS